LGGKKRGGGGGGRKRQQGEGESLMIKSPGIPRGENPKKTTKSLGYRIGGGQTEGGQIEK